jgi:hypothetical protein
MLHAYVQRFYVVGVLKFLENTRPKY